MIVQSADAFREAALAVAASPDGQWTVDMEVRRTRWLRRQTVPWQLPPAASRAGLDDGVGADDVDEDNDPACVETPGCGIGRCVVEVTFSPVWGCPILLFQVTDSNGRSLTLDEISASKGVWPAMAQPDDGSAKERRTTDGLKSPTLDAACNPHFNVLSDTVISLKELALWLSTMSRVLGFVGELLTAEAAAAIRQAPAWCLANNDAAKR
nr:hypothetical protein HK105_001526 [Polyrhizophydium stewartii]